MCDNFWLHRQIFLSNLCYEIALAKRRKNADRFGVQTSRYETGRLISVILSIYPWTLLRYFSFPFTTARFYIVFLSVSRLFSLRSSPFLAFLFFSFSLFTESAIRYPRRRAVCRSAPPVFQPSLPTPRTNILRLSATSTPHRSFLCVVWTSSFSTPACSVDKDRRDRKRRPTAVREGWEWVVGVSNTIGEKKESILSLLLSFFSCNVDCKLFGWDHTSAPSSFHLRKLSHALISVL